MRAEALTAEVCEATEATRNPVCSSPVVEQYDAALPTFTGGAGRAQPRRVQAVRRRRSTRPHAHITGAARPGPCRGCGPLPGLSSTCRSCSAEVPPGAKFCGQCGEPQALHCPACAERSRDDWTSDSASSAEGRYRRLPVGRRRPRSGLLRRVHLRRLRPGPRRPCSIYPRSSAAWLSVLFGTSRASPPSARAANAEDVRQLVTTYYAAARRITALYGGHDPQVRGRRRDGDLGRASSARGRCRGGAMRLSGAARRRSGRRFAIDLRLACSVC